MALLDKLFGRSKTLTDLSVAELRKEEILISRQRTKILAQIEKAASEKRKLFESGAKEKSPELRRALAMEFDLKTREQLLASRELTIRSKEMLTVQRLRMIREQQSRSSTFGRLKITDKDIGKLVGLIEDDAVTQEMYVERLDEILEIGERSDRELSASSQMGQAGQELLDIWSKLDRGDVDQQQAFEQADHVVRKRLAEGTPQ